MKLSAAIFGILFALAPACATDECTQLAEELKARQTILVQAKRQAGAYDVARKRALAAEGNANKLSRALGFDLTEEQQEKLLLERVKKIPTATITREVVPMPPEPEQPEPEMATQWRVRFEAKDTKAALDYLAKLLESPPLFRFNKLIREDKSTKRWHVEIRRPTVLQIPINPKSQPLAAGRKLTDISSQIGLCGAASTRNEIAKINEEIKALSIQAEELTIELPKAASYEGLRRRMEKVRDQESAARDSIGVFEQSLIATKAQLKGIASEGDVSVLEIWGTRDDRSKLEHDLIGRGLGERIQPRQDASKGVERILMRNAAEKKKEALQ
jgi:hypothetical protein